MKRFLMKMFTKITFNRKLRDIDRNFMEFMEFNKISIMNSNRSLEDKKSYLREVTLIFMASSLGMSLQKAHILSMKNDRVKKNLDKFVDSSLKMMKCNENFKSRR